MNVDMLNQLRYRHCSYVSSLMFFVLNSVIAGHAFQPVAETSDGFQRAFDQPRKKGLLAADKE